MTTTKLDTLENARKSLIQYERNGLTKIGILNLEEGFNTLYDIITEDDYPINIKKIASNIAEIYIGKVIVDVEKNYKLGDDIVTMFCALDSCEEINSKIGISDGLKLIKENMNDYIHKNQDISYDKIASALLTMSVDDRQKAMDILRDCLIDTRSLLKIMNRLTKQHSVENKPISGDKNSTIGIPWVVKNVSIPEGTEFKASYEGKTYHGKVISGALVIDGKRFKSPSSAGKHITGYDVNGWTFWSYRKLDVNKWYSMDSLR